MAFGKKASEAGPDGFPAKYDGWCSCCDDEITEGEMIAFDPLFNSYVHLEHMQ